MQRVWIVLLMCAVAAPVQWLVPGAHASADRRAGAHMLRAFLRQRALEGRAALAQDGAKLYEHFAELVEPYGYPLEEHFATTPDGFILRLFRIPRGRGEAPPGPAAATGLRPVVHLQHGLIDAASAWVLNGPEDSLALILADAGYDVWLGNVRGNSYSRNHTALSPSDAAFWAWSWDEMALADLPAMVDYELAATGAPSLAYVGHSQGTTMLLAALAAAAEGGPGSEGAARAAARLSVAALLGPVAFATNISSPVMAALAKLNSDELLLLLGVGEFMPSSELVSRLEGRLCELSPPLCANLLSAISGFNPDNVDASRVPLYVNYTPSGTSVQTVAHWAQLVRRPSKLVGPRRYDYGVQCASPVTGAARPCNQAKYGRLTPPRYDLSLVHTPLAIYSGGEDVLADPADIRLLLDALPRGAVVEWRDDPSYGHLDFTWAINARTRIYEHVLRVLARSGAAVDGPRRRRRAEGSRLVAADGSPVGQAAAAAGAAAGGGAARAWYGLPVAVARAMRWWRLAAGAS